MYSLQQQYNLLPGQYAKEIASLSIIHHIRSFAVELASCLSKGISAARVAKNNPNDNKEIARILNDN